jgi:hypothetical protein
MLVNGEVGLVWTPGGLVFPVFRFSFADGKIAAVDIIGDPACPREFDLAVLDEMKLFNRVPSSGGALLCMAILLEISRQ